MALLSYLIEKQEIPEGPKGTKATIIAMCELVKKAAQDPAWTQWWQVQVSDLPGKDYKAEAQRIFDIVKKYVRYVRDPVNLEVVSDPRATMFRIGGGDCDDHCVVIMSAALALGHQAAARTVAADPNRDDWSHVYAMIGIEDITQPNGIGWYPADTTQKSSYLGWNPPADRIRNVKDWICV